MSLPTEQKDMELTFKGKGRFNDTTLQQCRGSDHAVALTAHGRVFTWGQLFGSIGTMSNKDIHLIGSSSGWKLVQASG